MGASRPHALMSADPRSRFKQYHYVSSILDPALDSTHTTTSMPDEPKRRLTAGSDMYHNTAILDRILAIALEAGRKRDIYAVMLTARHGAELGPRYLYARISGSLIERTKPKVSTGTAPRCGAWSS